MKILKYFTISLLASLFITACSDEDASNASMAINKVYLEDVKSSVPDREVTFARLGQLIRIEGSGFTGLKKIYINGYETYFNNALLTDKNVWVTLNQNTPVSTASEDVRNTITFVKDNGTCTYSFIIRSASPSISSISCTLPQPGETVIVKGSNLEETSEVTLPGGVVVNEITNDEDGKWFSFVMPSGVAEGGSLTSTGANGTAISAPNFNDNSCYIINFDGNGTQGTWSATLQTSDLVEDPLNSGRGKVAMLIPESIGTVKAGTSSIKGYWTAGNDDPDDDWSRMTKFIPATTPADSIALQFDIYCPQPWDKSGQLEITLQNNLSNYGWQSACTRHSDEYINQACAWVPWMDRETGELTGPFQTSGWQTVTIPLSWFGNYTGEYASTPFSKIIADKNAGSYRNFGFLFCNSDVDFDGDASTENDITPSQAFNLPIYLDNFRIVRIGGKSVSDYPEEK